MEESDNSEDESEAECKSTATYSVRAGMTHVALAEPGVYWEDLPHDYRMLDVISCYEAKNAASEVANDSSPPKLDVAASEVANDYSPPKLDVVDSLTDLISRMPMPSDPGVWKVSVWVSVF